MQEQTAIAEGKDYLCGAILGKYVRKRHTSRSSCRTLDIVVHLPQIRTIAHVLNPVLSTKGIH